MQSTNRSTKPRFVWPLVAAIAIAGGTYFGAAGLTHSIPAIGATPSQTAKPTPEPKIAGLAPAFDLSEQFREVHNSLKDAVVNINVTKKPAASGRGRMQIPDELRGMLPPGIDPDQLQSPDDQEMQGTGSGVIVNADGYILTNNHVVNGADDISVTLNDGRELKAELVGTDPKSDLAVVRIKADHLTFAKFGDSDALDVGDWVLAFGSPFGFSQTMTQGIISAKGRTNLHIIDQNNPALQGLTYENFLQTDAAINPGNSGGPLVNLRGEVVGINAAIASNTGAYNGIGFSIPSNDAQYIMKSLMEHGKVVRGYLGIHIEDVNHPIPDHKGLVDRLHKDGFTGDKGVLVGDVTVDGPAANSGLQAGDVITAIDGKTFNTVDELRNQIARALPESKINLTIFRDGKTRPLSVTVGTQPDSIQQASLTRGRNSQHPDALDSKDLGISVEDLTDNQAKHYGLKAGAIVSKVDSQGPAAEMGLKPGDVITRVNKTDVASSSDFTNAMKSADVADGVKLLVRTDDGLDRLVYIEKK